MARSILKIAVVLILVALIWKLMIGGDDFEDVDRID